MKSHKLYIGLFRKKKNQSTVRILAVSLIAVNLASTAVHAVLGALAKCSYSPTFPS